MNAICVVTDKFKDKIDCKEILRKSLDGLDRKVWGDKEKAQAYIKEST